MQLKYDHDNLTYIFSGAFVNGFPLYTSTVDDSASEHMFVWWFEFGWVSNVRESIGTLDGYMQDAVGWLSDDDYAGIKGLEDFSTDVQYCSPCPQGTSSSAGAPACTPHTVVSSTDSSSDSSSSVGLIIGLSFVAVVLVGVTAAGVMQWRKHTALGQQTNSTPEQPQDEGTPLLNSLKMEPPINTLTKTPSSKTIKTPAQTA
jgi:hypothetical protein